MTHPFKLCFLHCEVMGNKLEVFSKKAFVVQIRPFSEIKIDAKVSVIKT